MAPFHRQRHPAGDGLMGYSKTQKMYFPAILSWTELKKQDLQKKLKIYLRDTASFLLKMLLPGLLSRVLSASEFPSKSYLS